MTENRRPAPRPRHALDDAPASRPLASDPGPAPAPRPARRTCNLRPCPEAPEWFGLCSAHRQTHRGLADPKGPR